MVGGNLLGNDSFPPDRSESPTKIETWASLRPFVQLAVIAAQAQGRRSPFSCLFSFFYVRWFDPFGGIYHPYDTLAGCHPVGIQSNHFNEVACQALRLNEAMLQVRTREVEHARSLIGMPG